jgi:hypothetical protein
MGSSPSLPPLVEREEEALKGQKAIYRIFPILAIRYIGLIAKGFFTLTFPPHQCQI